MKSPISTLVVTVSVFGWAAVAAEAPEYNSRPEVWDKNTSEWNAPKALYVPGDPLVLSQENMARGERINFVACPYIRDSEPTPLWFADHEGRRYFLRAQQNTTADVSHPQLRHKILVEGVVSDGRPIGDGIVLSPLRISVLPELDESCNGILPADGSRVEFAKRPPGPGGDVNGQMDVRYRRLALFGRLWSVDYDPDPVDAVKKVFTVFYDFDNAVTYSYEQVVEVVKYARDVDAAKIEIIGSRGSVLLSNGSKIVERAGVERERAEAVALIFSDFPIAKEIQDIRWESWPQSADGVSDFANRSVTMIVTPGQATAGMSR